MTATAAPARATTRTPRKKNLLSQKAIRQIHLWTSMVSLVVVLFFGVTGITLNHQEWTFGTQPVRTQVTGTLPATFKNSSGQVDFLAVATAIRGQQDVRGEVTDHSEQNGQGTITWQGAGYVADVQFDEATGEYTFTSTTDGWVAVINDLHKGRHTGTAWKWVIDASAVLLVAVAATGLTITFLIRTREKPRGLILAGIGGVLTLIGIVISLR
ncbi:PepSY-associated TM helix domain-containing protein [Mariniluteicoccus endophyticus]